MGRVHVEDVSLVLEMPWCHYGSGVCPDTTILRLTLALCSVKRKVLRPGCALATQLAPALFRSCGTKIHLLWYTSMSRHVRRATHFRTQIFLAWPNSSSGFREHWSVYCSFTMQLLTTTVNATCLASCAHKADLSILGVRAPNAVILFDNQHPSGNRSWKVRLRRDDV
jgi:hypothetical protein